MEKGSEEYKLIQGMVKIDIPGMIAPLHEIDRVRIMDMIDEIIRLTESAKTAPKDQETENLNLQGACEVLERLLDKEESAEEPLLSLIEFMAINRVLLEVSSKGKYRPVEGSGE